MSRRQQPRQPQWQDERAQDWDYGQQYAGDAYAHAAERLEILRDSLPEQAMKAYHALQLALQPHSRPNGSRPHFEKDFNESLCALFPHARNITARQIGTLNQWEVSIDDGPRMLCSVRLECLNDSADFQKELREKAKIVKETLLDDHGKWQRALQPGAGFNFDRLAQFERECAERISDGMSPEGRRWVEKGKTCQICRKSTDEDQLAGQHMCVVHGTFVCSQCGSDWTSHHARLKPDGKTIMGQQCMQCRGDGECTQWRVISREQREKGKGKGDEEREKGKGKGKGSTHKAELCEACKEFGNCMGMFYDPFVMTTALSLLSGHHVQWNCFSDTMPELLIADVGPPYNEMKICLQPHVHVVSSAQTGFDQPGYNAWNRDPDYARQSDYSRNDQQYGGFEYDYRQQQQPHPRNMRRDRESDFAPPTQRQSAGVKDVNAFNSFLNKVDTRMQDAPQRSMGPVGAGYQAQHPPMASPAMYQYGAAQGSGYMQSPAAYGGQYSPVDASINVKKSNKISSRPSSIHGAADDMRSPGQMGDADHGSSMQTTPLLDALQPLRRAQLLQIVLRVVAASGGSEVEKFAKAEEFLQVCGGDYNQTYEYVKKISEG